jgi:hypothetical protein
MLAEVQACAAEVEHEVAATGDFAEAALVDAAAIGRIEVAQHAAAVGQHLDLDMLARHAAHIDLHRTVAAAADAPATDVELPPRQSGLGGFEQFQRVADAFHRVQSAAAGMPQG